MSTASPILLASATLLGLALTFGAGPARAADQLPEGVQVAYCSQSLNTLSLSPSIDVSTVAKVKFFITPDGGKTWVLGQETIQPPTSHERPRFPFKVEHDGVYGIMTCVTYRDGRAEVEPHPGQTPQYALVIDSTPPAISRFDASLVGATANRTVVHCVWSTSDMNPTAEPVVIEASTDGGTHFTAVKRGSAEGAGELTVPIEPLTRQLHLRLIATDRAGNSTTSPVRMVAVTTPEAVQAPVAAATTAPVAPQAGGTAAVAAPHDAPPEQPAPTVPPSTGAATPAAAVKAPGVTAPAAVPDAVNEFAQASKGLPSLSDIGVAPPSTLPEIAPVAQDRHSPTPIAPPPPAAAAIPASATVAQPAAPAQTPAPAQPAPHADVVVAGVPQSASAPAHADAPLPGSNAVDQEYFSDLTANRQTSTPRQGRRPIPAEDLDAADSPPRAARTMEPAHPAPAAAPAAPVARVPAPPPRPQAPVVPLSDDGQHAVPIPATYLTDDQALHKLGLARAAASGGRIDDALDLYEHLFASVQARQAAAEELQLLTSLKRPLDVLIVVQALPRELLTDTVRLEQGRALSTLARYDQAFATLSRIASRSPESREALMLMARGYAAKGQTAEARKVLEFLARGSDRFAADAAAQLGQPAR